MAIVRWEPFRDLVTVQDRMNRIFDEAFRGVPRGAEEDWALGGAWAPAVDIYEHEGNLVLKAELPGIDPKDVDVRVENNMLTLRGERKFESEVKREQYHRVERAYGTFSRSFTLPNVVDTEQDQGRVQGRRAARHAAAEGRSQAEADLDRGQASERAQEAQDQAPGRAGRPPARPRPNPSTAPRRAARREGARRQAS